MSVYEIITKEIIKKLEEGVIPWEKPWASDEPRNITGRKYKGINTILLSTAPYNCPIWATFRQIQERGGQIKKGEKSKLVVFYKPFFVKNGEIIDESEVEDYLDDEEIEKKWTLRYYRVFNLEQTTLDINKYWQPNKGGQFDPLKRAEEIYKNMPTPPALRWGGDRAFYEVEKDRITLPPREKFFSAEGYYSTLFHELVHSTGHQKRLGRKSLIRKAAFGSKEYSKEELVAEIGSAFLLAECNIPQKYEDRAAYIGSWLKVLKNDKRLVVIAASQAQKAADYILGKIGKNQS